MTTLDLTQDENVATRVGDKLKGRVAFVTDPRTDMLREKARTLAKAKGRDEEMALYEMIERIGPGIFNKNRAKPRDLCANVDFYSAITLRALGFPTEMITVLYAIARTAGWIAHWKEMIDDTSQRIGRPRQLYTGPTERTYVSMEAR